LQAGFAGDCKEDAMDEKLVQNTLTIKLGKLFSRLHDKA
jgi:hypothetical protein